VVELELQPPRGNWDGLPGMAAGELPVAFFYAFKNCL
jgi:hypothetical protein